MYGGKESGLSTLWVDAPSSSLWVDAPSSSPADSILATNELAPDAGQVSTPFVLGNRPALTGLRAPVIAVVLVFHSNFRAFPGAWAAVGAFFVLSGFLITSMLANEQRKTGGINFEEVLLPAGRPPSAAPLHHCRHAGGLRECRESHRRQWTASGAT